MSEGIRINVPATPDFVRANPPSLQQIVDVLATALQVGHGISNGHQWG